MGKLSRLSNTYLPFVNATICLSAHFPEWLVTVDWVSLFPLRCRNYVPIADSNPIINSWWISIPMIHGIHGLTGVNFKPFAAAWAPTASKALLRTSTARWPKSMAKWQGCAAGITIHISSRSGPKATEEADQTLHRDWKLLSCLANTGVWGALWRLCSLFFQVKHYSYIYICIDNDIVEC